MSSADRGSDDWRLTPANVELLRGASLQWKDYPGQTSTRDHDHCELCWREFVPEGHAVHEAGTVHAGFTMAGPPADPRPDYHWVCGPCFDDLARYLGMTGDRPPARDIAER
jgi:hypothetical protein